MILNDIDNLIEETLAIQPGILAKLGGGIQKAAGTTMGKLAGGALLGAGALGAAVPWAASNLIQNPLAPNHIHRQFVAPLVNKIS